MDDNKNCKDCEDREDDDDMFTMVMVELLSPRVAATVEVLPLDQFLVQAPLFVPVVRTTFNRTALLADPALSQREPNLSKAKDVRAKALMADDPAAA